jgi:hypothetical protein
MDSHGTVRTIWAIAAALLALALPPSAAASSRGHLALFPGKGGADTVWISGNDAGQAVGQKLKGSVSYFAYFDGKRAHILTKQLGRGAFSSIDALGEAVGTTSSGYPVYYDTRSGHKVIGPMPGRATGIAIGPLVAVTLSTGMAELWNPLSGGTLSLGQASTTAVNAWGYVVGHAPDGNLWVSVPNLTGGAIQYEFPVQGSFDRINNLNQATGYERQGGTLVQSKSAQLHPIELTIPRGMLPGNLASGIRMYPLPSYAKDGVLTGATDSGKVLFGNVGSTDALIPSVAGVWRRGTFKKIPYRTLLKGLFRGVPISSAISFYNDIGLFGGEITVKGLDIADLFEPAPIDKIVGLRVLAHQEPWVTFVAENDIVGRLKTIHHFLAEGNSSKACTKLLSLHGDLFDEGSYVYSHYDNSDADYFLAVYDDLLGGLDDLGRELGCDPHFYKLMLSPNESQSPYPGTALAWSTYTS